MEKKFEKFIFENENNAKKLFEKEDYLKLFYKKISLTPVCISNNQYDDIKRTSEDISKLIEKTIDLYYKNSKMQEYYGLAGKQKNVLNQVKKRDKNIYISRYDAFLSKGKIKFLEFNINFPGGIERLDCLFSKVFDFYSGEFGLNCKNSITSDFVKMVKRIYRGSGMVALVYGSQFDKMSFGSADKIAMTLKKELGVDADFMHWSDLDIKEDGIFYKNQKVGLFFRLTLERRMWQYDYSVARKVLEAMKKFEVPMFNLPQSYFAGRKDLFAVWYEDWFRNMLCDKEIDLIEKCIPKTYLLSNNLISKNQLLNNKNEWVLKPVSGYGGKGVYVGKQMSDNKWKQIIGKHFGSKLWIAQEYIVADKISLIELDTKEEKINSMEGYVNISPWVIDGKMSGITARYADNLIINVKKGGGIMPVFIKK